MSNGEGRIFQTWNGEAGDRLLNVGGQFNLNNRVLFTIADDGSMTLGEGVTPDEAAREFVELVNQRVAAYNEIVQVVADMPPWRADERLWCAFCAESATVDWAAADRRAAIATAKAAIKHDSDCLATKSRALLGKG